MAKKLLIGCYSFSSGDGYGTRYVDVVSWIRQVMERVERVRTSLMDLETGNGFQAIFVAPEYLFTGQNDTHTREPMSEAEKDDVLRDLCAISNDYKNILMFPGTIFYKQSLALDVAFHKFQANLIAAELNVKNYGLSAGGSERDKSDVLTTGWKTSGGVKIPSLTKVSTVARKPKIDSCRAHNCMYAFLGGKSVMVPYAKQWDFKETEGAKVDQVLFVPGTSSGMRDIQNFDFGFEICFDHGCGTLKGKNTDVDFHIVVSDNVDTDEGKMAMRKGAGYFIHASSDANNTCVYRRRSTGAVLKYPPTFGKVEANSIAFWVVDTVKK